MSSRYLLQRLGSLLLVLFGVSILTFAIIPLIPGSPARVRLGVQATDETVAAVEKQLGLDRPLTTQYVDWLQGIVFRGDFGRSLINDKPISAEIARRLPATLVLAVAALLVGLLIALPAGIASALRPGGKLDLGVSVLSQIGVSIPDFWMGILLILVFAENLQWLPSSGFTSLNEDPADWLRHLILPAVTAGIISGSIMTRFTRSALLEVLHRDYVRTARAKGLTERVVVVKHVLRNAAISIATIIGLQLATLFSAVVVVEIIFSWPGLGSLALQSTLQRDYPVLQAAVLMSAMAFAVINLLTDLSYVLLDPSIDYA
ncbi:MAG: ABC transporter permease [Trueperaceae bacterium]|nr:MAG: ABC transporter permease [Trueperaceae bacterium]